MMKWLFGQPKALKLGALKDAKPVQRMIDPFLVGTLVCPSRKRIEICIFQIHHQEKLYAANL